MGVEPAPKSAGERGPNRPPPPAAQPATSPRAWLAPLPEPGWLFFLAGLALVVTTVLIPAADDLAEARWAANRTLAEEQRRIERVRRHEETLAELDASDPRLLRSLAAEHLRLIPEDRDAIAPGTLEPSIERVRLLESLEPAPVAHTDRPTPDSRLYRWATNDRTRLWVLATGALLMMIGLLPSAKAKPKPING